MAIKISDFGGTNWQDGEVLYSADLIDTIKVARPKILQIYTGSGYDTSSGEASYEFSFNVSDIKDYNYLFINLNGDAYVAASYQYSVFVRTKAQYKVDNGSYQDIEDYKVRARAYSMQSGTNYLSETCSDYTIVLQLTSAIKSGTTLYIKIFARVDKGSGSSGSYSNIKTIFYVM